ncbi:MAG: ComEA family DNA-binding protein, partial [Spirillospora sp.]
PWAAPVKRRRLPWPARVVLASIPLISFGTATWAVLAYFAARRRSLWLALMTAVQLGLTIIFFVSAVATEVDGTTWWDVPLLISLLLTTVGGAVYIAVVTAEPSAPGPDGGHTAAMAPTVALIEGSVRREQARSLVAHHPEVARTLRIGRPDLARTFDDGGLVDVNSAPEHVLGALRGLNPSQVKLIVLSRTALGPVASVDDLVTRQILPFQTVHALRETLIAVPPTPVPAAEAPMPRDVDAPGGTAKPAAGV